jgi:hypothetical protein
MKIRMGTISAATSSKLLASPVWLAILPRSGFVSMTPPSTSAKFRSQCSRNWFEGRTPRTSTYETYTALFSTKKFNAMGDPPRQRRFMDIKEDKKGGTASRPEAGTRDPKAKGAQRDENPDRGRNRVPNTEDEIKGCGTENETSQEKARVEQGGKNHRANTN